MSIPVRCPGCQHAFAVADRFAGKKGKCPRCGAVFKAESPTGGLEISVFPEVEPSPPPAVAAPLATAAHSPAPLNPTVTDSGPVATFPTVPRGTPVAAQAGPTFVSSRVSDSGPHARRPKSSPLPLVIGLAIGALAIVGIGIGFMFSLSGNDSTSTVKKDAQETTSADNAAESPPSMATPPVASTLDTAPLAPLSKSVLALEVKSAQGTTKAACFLVADGGYAVTAAHLLTQATSVEAINFSDIRIAVSGIAALDAPRDLAIIKLEPTLPVPLDKLTLETTAPAWNTDVAAIELPGAATPIMAGKFKSSDVFAKLSPSLRSKLKVVFSEWADDAGIVLHSIKPSANSIGVPLVTQDGRVIGMHIAPDAAGGLAIHARHIATLLESAGSEVKPFGAPMVATNDPVTPTVDPTAPSPPMPLPTPAPPGDPIDELIARIVEHRDECAKKDWTASDAVDYAQFQLLARFVNEAATGADTVDVPPAVKEKLETAVRDALLSLTPEKWPDEAAWNKTNEQAVKGLETAGQGFFSLVRITVPTSQGNMIGDLPIAVAEIVGQSKMIVLPFKSGGDKFGVDARLLVLGMHDPTTLIKFNNIDVPMVRTKYVLAVEKQD